jgi:four helix bundle protein
MEKQQQGGINMSKENRAFDTEGRLLDFAVSVIITTESLPGTEAGKHISRELVGSATSSAVRYAQAQGAGSRDGFVDNLKGCLRELRGTKIWLLMIERANLVKSLSKLERVIEENEALIAIFAKSIKTAKQKG